MRFCIKKTFLIVLQLIDSVHKGETQARRLKMWIVLFMVFIRVIFFIKDAHPLESQLSKMSTTIYFDCPSAKDSTKHHWIRLDTKRSSIYGCHTKIYWTEFPSETSCLIVRKLDSLRKRKARTVLVESRWVAISGGKARIGN